MNSNDKHIIYTAQDIEKYFSGKLTPLQMHQMEKAALDDPFLAEAMEGYGAMTDKEWEKQLAAASRQLAGSNAKVVTMHRNTGKWWKAAAAILVIGCGTALTFVLTTKKKEKTAEPQIAQADKTIQIPPPATKETTGTLPATQQTQQVIIAAAEKEKAADNTIIAQADQASANRSDNFAYKPGSIPVADSVKLEPAYFDNTDTKNAAAVTTAPVAAKSNAGETVGIKNNTEAERERTDEILNDAAKRQAQGNAARKEKVLNNFFNAQVIAPDNTPLPFSNISVTSGRFETYADVKGNFRLFSTDSVLTIEIKSIGYQPRTYALRSNQPLNKIILLDNEQGLKDKNAGADVGLRARAKRPSVFGDSAINVEPKDGWDNYNTYAANNLDIPDETLKNEFHGEVELSFDVKANGAISNIRVSKSLGPAYDEAAKQLIMKGPQWKVKKGRKTSANVKVKF